MLCVIWLTVQFVGRFDSLKDDRQRFSQKVSKKQFRTVYYNPNACG